MLNEICEGDIGKKCTVKKSVSLDHFFGSKIKGELYDVEKDWLKIKTKKKNQTKIRLIRVSDIKEIQLNH